AALDAVRRHRQCHRLYAVRHLRRAGAAAGNATRAYGAGIRRGTDAVVRAGDAADVPAAARRKPRRPGRKHRRGAAGRLRRFSPPPRKKSLVPRAPNTGGALLGGFAASRLVRAERVRNALSEARHRIFLAGKLGDVGLALLVLWLVAQINPGIPLFAVTFDVEQVQGSAVALMASAPDTAAKLIEAAECALQF